MQDRLVLHVVFLLSFLAKALGSFFLGWLSESFSATPLPLCFKFPISFPNPFDLAEDPDFDLQASLCLSDGKTI